MSELRSPMKYSWLVNTLLGLSLAAGGTVGVVNEMRQNAVITLAAVAAKLPIPPVHSGHIYAFLTVAILGGLLINPSPNNPAPLFTVIKGIVVVVAPIVPWSKVAQARRASVEVPKGADPHEGD